MKKLSAISVVIFICVYAAAQQRPETGLWTGMNLHLNLSNHWQWHNDGGYRTLGTTIHPLQYLYRTGIRYMFNKQTSVAAGVAWFFTKTDFDKLHHEFGTEFRFWEEVNHHQPLKNDWQLLIRFRMDQRFFAATSVSEDYTAYRFRFRTGLNKKLNEKWSLQLTDEYMQQISGDKFSLDQNRLTFSGIYQFNRTTQLLGGYLWAKWPNAHQHILTFIFSKIISLHGS